MAKRVEKLHIITLILAVAILAAVGVFSVAATLAATDNWLHVELPYAATSSTDTLMAAVDLSDPKTAVVAYTQQNKSDFHIHEFDLIAYDTDGKCHVQNGVSLVKDGDVLESSTMSVSLGFEPAAVYAYPAAERRKNADGTVDIISYGNVYVNDFFGLQTANNGALSDPTDPVAADGAFKNVFFTGDFTVDKPLTFTPPCALHLLRSTITLNADLTIKHAYGGRYGIDADGGNDGGKFVQNGGALSAITPNAFFGVQKGIVTDAADAAVDPPVVCSPETLTENTDVNALVGGLLAAAQEYLTAYVPARLTRSVILPSAYAVSGVTYAYTVSDESVMTDRGVIFRGKTDQPVTLTVTAKYNGIYNKVYKGETTAKFELALTVVGTGAQSAADELSLMLGEALSKSLTDAGGGEYAPAGDVDLTELLNAYRKIDFVDVSNVTIGVSEPSGSSLAVGDARADAYNVTEGAAGDKVRLAFASRVINGAPLSVAVSANGSDGAVQATLPLKYALAGMSFTEVIGLLETLIYTPEFSTAESIYDFVVLADDALCRGAEKVASSLGVTKAELKAIALTDDELAALNEAADKQPFIRDKWAVWATDERAFAVDAAANTVKVKTLAADTHYVVVQRFVIDTDFNDAVTDDGEYFAYRVALVPDRGIGGSDTTQYIEGNTFADFYETLDNGRLLESYVYPFKIATTGIGIYPVIEGDVGAYCRFVYRAADGSYKPVTAAAAGLDKTEYYDGIIRYYIEIDVAGFPARNHSAKAVIYFYYTAQTDAFIAYAQGGFNDDPAHPEYAASCFTTQSYGFTLPGIYRAGEKLDFVSESLYDFVLNAQTAGVYIYDAYRKHADADGKFAFAMSNYLYVDGASAVCRLLDCRDIVTAEPIDLKGIELLTGTAGFVFDNVPIGSIAGAFSAVNTHITSLSFKNCGLAAEILGAYLSYCQGLTELDLSDNAIGSLNGLLYRTVQKLRVANCGLKTLAGVSGLPNLTELDLSKNAIKYFGELTSLTKLKTVNVAGNDVTDGNIAPGGSAAYGTTGEVNIPVYVYLLNVREATVVGDSCNIVVGNETGNISPERQLASLILTGVEYDRTFKGPLTGESFSKEVVWDKPYTIKSEKLIGANFAEMSDASSLTSGDAFYFLVTVTYSRENAAGETVSATCYALYEATYGGAA